jgi:predicted nucleic acid-binding protein
LITAVDSSVILDVLLDDPKHAQSAIEALTTARREGALRISEAVLAEIFPALDGDDLKSFLSDWALTFDPSSQDSAALAGQILGAYLSAGGKRGRVAADFLIGAHAQLHADRLLTRDQGFYREYFEALSVWNPQY